MKKTLYLLTCIVLAIVLYGCKEKGVSVSVFDGLPESTYVTEAKSALENKKPLAVAFLAEWCPHCQRYKPVFLETKGLYENRVTFININVDDEEGKPISTRFQVRGIPTTAFIRTDGSVFKIHVGGLGKEELTEIIDNLSKSRRKKRKEPVAPFPIEPVETKQQIQEDQNKEPEKLDNQEEVINGNNDEVKDEEPQDLIKQDGVQEEATETKPEDETSEGENPDSLQPDSIPGIEY